MVDITWLVELVVWVVFLIIARYLIPWLKAKLGSEKLAKIIDTIDIFVAAAEQVANREGYNSAWKKQHVIELLEKNGYTVDETIDEFIEAAVIRLHNELIAGE